MDSPRMIDTRPGRCPPTWKAHRMNPRKSIFNRFDKDELHPEQSDHCQLKYLNVCTSPLFERTLAEKCKKVELARLYREIVIEFSRVAISGGGDRNCVFHIGTMP